MAFLHIASTCCTRGVELRPVCAVQGRVHTTVYSLCLAPVGGLSGGSGRVGSGRVVFFAGGPNFLGCGGGEYLFSLATDFYYLCISRIDGNRLDRIIPDQGCFYTCVFQYSYKRSYFNYFIFMMLIIET